MKQAQTLLSCSLEGLLMTETRKNAIALLVMKERLFELGFKDSSEASSLVTLARTFQDFHTMALVELMVRIFMNKDLEDRDGCLAYKWLLSSYARTDTQISNRLRRDIGNQAERLSVHKIQLIQFYRRFFIDLVEKELEDKEDEVPLHTK